MVFLLSVRHNAFTGQGQSCSGLFLGGSHDLVTCHRTATISTPLSQQGCTKHEVTRLEEDVTEQSWCASGADEPPLLLDLNPLTTGVVYPVINFLDSESLCRLPYCHITIIDGRTRS